MIARIRKALKQEQGFTLIELVVVLVVLGLLIALALPNYLAARQTAAKSEARVIGQEWRTITWACYLQTGLLTSCNTDTLVGFSETNVVNWNFTTTASAYATNATQVIRCAPGQGTLAAGLTYKLFLTVTGAGAGSSSDKFDTNSACP